MKILITGCCGFIGFHLASKLIKNKKYKVYGIDNLNSYYDIQLKKDRLAILNKSKDRFIFNKIDILNKKNLKNNFSKNKYDCVIHLAAQAGVRYSIDNPEIYLKTNINGFFNIMELSKNIKVKHFIYASTSSVYGNNKNFPLSEDLDTSFPISFYAATKKANEVMAYSYSSIYKLPTTGLRFFTVYGPYGRPDMALFKFTKNIINGKKVEIYNHGKHIRDFTYIDDIVTYIDKLIKKPNKSRVPYQIFNVASNKPKSLMHFLKTIENIVGKKSIKNYLPMQQGDIIKTHGEITQIYKKTSYLPRNSLNNGIKLFVEWFKKYYK